MKARLQAEDPNEFETVFNLDCLPERGSVLIVRKPGGERRYTVEEIMFELDAESGDQTALLYVTSIEPRKSAPTGPITYPSRGIA